MNDADMQVADDPDLAPPADEFESVMMFLNHSSEPNVGARGPIASVATRDVAAGEERTLDHVTIGHGAGPMACCGVVCGEDWRKPGLQRKYVGHFAWHLERMMRQAPGALPPPVTS